MLAPASYALTLIKTIIAYIPLKLIVSGDDLFANRPFSCYNGKIQGAIPVFLSSL